MKKINNPNLNSLALTVMYNHNCVCGNAPYEKWVKDGWQFYFIIKPEGVFAIMERDITKDYRERQANGEISDLVLKYK